MPTADRLLRRRVHLHHPAVPAAARRRRQVSRRTSTHFLLHLQSDLRVQTYEVIGSPPNVAVPTHFAKVVLTSRPSSPSTPNIPELSAGAFVLPNAEIPDDVSFARFQVPSASHFPLYEGRL